MIIEIRKRVQLNKFIKGFEEQAAKDKERERQSQNAGDDPLRQSMEQSMVVSSFLNALRDELCVGRGELVVRCMDELFNHVILERQST